MEYVKINSLWKRHLTEKDPVTGEIKFLDKGKSGNKLIPGSYSCEEFSNICKWHVVEKVDGTNIRLFFKQVDGQRLIPSIMGRTSASQIPTHLLAHLQCIATWETFDKAFDFSSKKEGSFEVYLFGEGFGSKIQEPMGSKYSKEPNFTLFDVVVDNTWLEQSSVKEIALKLEIPYVPEIGIMTENEIVEFVKRKPFSNCSEAEQVMEGVIARAHPLVLFRDGKPVMFKLKCKDLE